MKNSQIPRMLDDIAGVVMALDPLDHEQIEQLVSAIDELAAHAEAVAASDLLSECRRHLKLMTSGPAEGAETHLEAVSSILEQAQKRLTSDGRERTADGAFTPPPWVDPTSFQEFLGIERLNLDELEGDILSIESDGQAAVPAVRRRVHTMKGEASVLGLDEFSEVCHAMEDVLAVPPSGREWFDRLLAARDWLLKSIECYASARQPPATAELVALLRKPLAATANGGHEGARATASRSSGTKSADSKGTSTKTEGPRAAPAKSIEASPTPGKNEASKAGPTKGESAKATNQKAAPAKGESPKAAEAKKIESTMAPDTKTSPVEPAKTSATKAAAGDAKANHPTTTAPISIGEYQTVVRDEETVALFGEFLAESEEGLAKADTTLMNIEREGVDPEMVNQLFRIFHTIKGVAGALELGDITTLAHTTETMLNLVRQGTLELRGVVLDLVFDSTQMMSQMLSAVRRAVEHSTGVESTQNLSPLVERLEAVVRGEHVAAERIVAPPGAKLGEILAAEPLSIPPAALEEALAAQKDSGRKLGEELVARGSARPKQIAQALRAQNEAGSMDNSADATAGKIRETIKVDLGRVDSLVEMIGELVIVETMVVNAPEITALTSPRIRTYLNQLGKITRDLQDVGMRMRMVPVRSVFQKMARMVRDLSRNIGKQVQLEQSGEGTEMDRSMVEQVADPLVHMIRNAVDHGIESTEDRIRAGKSPVGTVRLSAYHEGGSIVIEVGDDGRGLHRESILRKATAQGLVKDGEKLTDHEVWNLIFAPGFSTASKVTEISGRGVGMDVVKRNVEQMRGRVQISTVPGNGTTFKIVLPLTLAIIDGMLVACGQERYIIPTLSIVESIQPDASMLVTFARRGELVNVRGEILPLIRLDRLFGIPGAKSDATKGLVVVVESVGRKVGLLVDEVITQQQVVIKNLGSGLRNVRYVAGAAILSDGRVGLILNMEEIGGSLQSHGRGYESGHSPTAVLS